IATLVGLIGAGGLGNLIIKGLRTIQVDYLLAGTLPAAALALISDWILGRLERWLAPKSVLASTSAEPE
ncbi:MAG: choline ABC transporter permease, partial [bacterium]